MNRTFALMTASVIAALLFSVALMAGCTAQPRTQASSSQPETSTSAPQPSSQTENDMKTIACIGDSITYGYGLDSPETESWPALIQAKLGNGWKVVNLGVVGSTLVDEGSYPYRSTGNVKRAKELDADMFIIMLGTNDANEPVLDTASYRAQLTALVDELAASSGESSPDGEPSSASEAQFVLMAPPCTFYDEAVRPGADKLDRIIANDIRDTMKSVAAEKGARYIDLYALTENHPEWFPDPLPPSAEGDAAIADYVYDCVFNQG